MNKTWITIAAIAIVGAAVVFVTRSPRDVDVPVSPNTPTGVSPSRSAQAPPSTSPMTPTADATSQAPERELLPEEPKETFRVGADGKLILDDQTRLKVEAFFARTDPKDLDTAAQKLVQDLPPAAAAEALDVVDRYRNYVAAQDQNYSDEAPASPEDAIVQLESLHALRVEQFGPKLAKAFYGDEERLSRELIELMRLEKDQSLTMEEKADRAQRLHDQLSSVSAADKGERPQRE
jgi:hypothetical protein